ncbi:MAG: hypothetical protein BGO44_04045 [Legionella sp. 39-23]|nr:MAG: hypothetical protein BGO44_04045 [Legionella sp. 39-23]
MLQEVSDEIRRVKCPINKAFIILSGEGCDFIFHNLNTQIPPQGQLQCKIGIPEPKIGLLLNQMSMPDGSTSNLPDIQISTSEHHTSHTEHPLTEQKLREKILLKNN